MLLKIFENVRDYFESDEFEKFDLLVVGGISLAGLAAATALAFAAAPADKNYSTKNSDEVAAAVVLNTAIVTSNAVMVTSMAASPALSVR